MQIYFQCNSSAGCPRSAVARLCRFMYSRTRRFCVIYDRQVGAIGSERAVRAGRGSGAQVNDRAA